MRTDEVGVLAGAVDQMAARLEHIVRSEKELLANVSHEMRTPLARIRVLLELLDEEQGGETAIREHLAGLGGDVAELEKLLDDVLLTARLELSEEKARETELVLHKQNFPVGDLIDEISNRWVHDKTSFDLHVAVDPRLTDFNGDRGLLRRVLENLLDNAVKYSGPGSSIDLEVRLDNTEIKIEIRDRGIGIEEDDRMRVFDPFFRTERGRLTGKAGIGIGLTLCRRIVEAHQGTIEVRSRRGGGTVLVVSLPLSATG
jgi:signal transduction histidine kinase